MRAFLKSSGWTLAADFTGIALMASLMVGGVGSPVFAVLLLVAPVLLAACMLWSPEA